MITYEQETFNNLSMMLTEFAYKTFKFGAMASVIFYLTVTLIPTSFFIGDIELTIADHINKKPSEISFYREPIMDIAYSFKQELKAHEDAPTLQSDGCKRTGSATIEIRPDNIWNSNWDDFWHPAICEPSAGVYYVHVVGVYRVFGIAKDINYRSNYFTVADSQ